MASPPIFKIFSIPAQERLATLRALLDGGVDPNIVDPVVRRGETLLGRAFSVDRSSVDMEIVQELLDRGANPLRGNMWSEEVGEMEPFFDQVTFLAWENPSPRPSVVSEHEVLPSPIGPHVTKAILKACKDHGHTDEDGNDALSYMVQKLRSYSHMHFSTPIRQAIALNFAVDQSIEGQPTVVHFLLHISLSTIQAGIALPFNAVWDFVSDFIEADSDMSKQDAKGNTAWDVIDSLARYARGIPAYDKIQADRQRAVLDAKTLQATPLHRTSRL
jgi:hypothetical protein